MNEKWKIEKVPETKRLYEVKERISSIPEYIEVIEYFIKDVVKNKDMSFYFRGESKDYGKTSLQSSICRSEKLIKNENEIYKEMQRFNTISFEKDKTTIDHLSRMQHFLCPTRLLDFSEDALTGLYFALEKPEKSEKGDTGVVYVFAIPNKDIKYYDSDTVTILANLAKFSSEQKAELLDETIKFMKQWKIWNRKIPNYNEKSILQYLLHEIKTDKSYFLPKIRPKDIFSVQCVKTKLSTDRIYSQKGAFLIFGLNANNINEPIPLINEYKKPKFWKRKKNEKDEIGWEMPLEEMVILKMNICCKITTEDLKNLGVSKPYVYPGMEKTAEHFRNKFS